MAMNGKDQGSAAVLHVAVLDFFIVNVAIPDLQRDLGASASQIQLVVAGYALA
jgi:MFS family permease